MRKWKIMIVEDETIVALDIKRSLEGLGYEVVDVLESGEETINRVGELQPDLLLMDIVLKGGMNGIEAAMRIHEQFDIPVVYLTAHTENSIFRRARETEPYGYIVKPAGQDIIYTTIETAMSRYELERRLKDSEERYRALVENINDVIYSVDADGYITYISPIVEKISQYTVEELIGSNFTELVHAYDLHGLLESYDRTKAWNLEPYEFRMLDKDGSIHYVRTSSRPVEHDGVLIEVTGVLTDLTEYKDVKEKLHESERRFRDLLENVNLFGLMLDDQGNITFCNNYLLTLTGWKREEVMGKDWFQTFMTADNRDEQRESVFLNAVQKGVFPSCYESDILTRKGERRVVRWNSTVLNDTDGRVVGIASIGDDITERIKIEQELIRSEENLEKAQHIARLGSFELNLETNVFTTSEEMARIFKYDKTSIGYDEWKRFVHPDDRVSVLQKIQEAIRDNKPYDIEFRIVCTDDNIETIRAQGEVVRDENGNPMSFFGTGLDVTEQKRIEEALRLSIQEKETLLKEVHHRVKNNFQIILSLLQLQERRLEDRKLIDAFRDSITRLRAMALIHERLYQTKTMSRIEFADYLNILTRELYQTYQCDHNSIKISIDTEPVELEIKQAIPCGLIVNELLANALKHAFPPEYTDNGTIQVSLHRNINTVELIISDNGIGMNENVSDENKNSLGLRLVGMILTKQLKGSLTSEYDNGTRHVIRFKLKNQG